AEVERQVSLGGILINEDLKTINFLETACEEIDFSINVGSSAESIAQAQGIFNEIVTRIEKTNERLKKALTEQASGRLDVARQQIESHHASI
ncbi:MAG: DUF2379 family protein, partial [Pseudomonadota bacterium]